MNRNVFLLSIVIILFTQSYAQSDQALSKQVRLSLEELKTFVALPNDANNPKDINQNLVWLVKAFKSRGFETKLLPTEGIPLFYAELSSSADKPTILFYMHFDGQSVDRSKWNQKDPYEVALKEFQGGDS